MRFCPKCGNLMSVVKKRKNVYLVCKKGHEFKMGRGEKISISSAIKDQKTQIIVIGKDEGIAELPKTKIMCPKCENMEAHWWMQQTRAADEPPTMFYKCTKCSYSWRSYG